MLQKALKVLLAILIIGTSLISAGCSSSGQYELVTSVEPGGAGTVSPGGIYDKDSKIRIVATPNEGYSFKEWSGAASGTNPAVTITMDSDKSVIAHFVTGSSGTTTNTNTNTGTTNTNTTVDPSVQYIVTVAITPAGAGTVSPLGGVYDKNTVLTLTANPTGAYQYVWWSGDVSGSTNSISFTVDSNKAIVAHFETEPVSVASDNYTLITHVSPEGSGLVTPATGSYEAGSSVKVTAMAAEGYTFHHWTGGATGYGASTTVTMDSNLSVVAVFEEIGALTLQFPDLRLNGDIPNNFSCQGNNVSPYLNWVGAPYDTSSFVLIVDDPDASGFTHWVVYNIPKDIRELAEGIPEEWELEDGTRQGINSYGHHGYDGPCPPVGQEHKYRFTLYAIDTTINLPVDAVSKTAILNEIQGHILEQSTVTGYFMR